ncbi:MAG: EamA family transporter [Fusobacteriaceae bacterium]
MNFLGEILGLTSALGWVLSTMTFEKISRQFSGLPVNILKLFITLILFSFIAIFSRGHLFPFDASNNVIIYLVISGFFGLFIGDYFIFQALMLVKARILLLVVTIEPMLLSLFGFLFLGEKLTILQFFGVVCTSLGIMLVILTKPKENGGSKKYSIGVSKKGLLFCFIAVLADSIGLLFTKLGTTNFDAVGATQLRTVAAILAFLFFITRKKQWSSVGICLKNKKAMLYLLFATCASMLGIWSIAQGFKYAKVAVVSTLGSTGPILIIPILVFLHKEKVNVKEIFGAIMSVIGVALFFI